MPCTAAEFICESVYEEYWYEIMRKRTAAIAIAIRGIVRVRDVNRNSQAAVLPGPFLLI